MARLGLRITDEMEDALNQESSKTHIPTSALVRMAIERLLKERGYKLTDSVTWGGKRQPEVHEWVEVDAIPNLESLPDLPGDEDL